MYTQFFGSYLLRNNVVTREQLLDAMSKCKTTRIKLGTIAINRGLMTAAEVDECCFLQTREDKRFGEIAMERGYLTWKQVEELLGTQEPDYILLGQTLVDSGALTNSDLERALNDYQTVNEIDDLEDNIENNDKIKTLIENLLKESSAPVSEYVVMFLNLLFNDLIRFIGEDFTPLAPIIADSHDCTIAVNQKVVGPVSFETYADMNESAAIDFASRYAKEEFTEMDEYVEASLEDFLNLHNGLYVVNMSNQNSIECSLEPPLNVSNQLISIGNNGIIIPIIYPFGLVEIIIGM